MKLQMRGAIASAVIIGSALVAAACGGSGSGSSEAAKNAAALDYVPSSALGYVTVDTDFEDDAWKNVDELAKVVNPDFTSVQDEVADSASNDSDKVDWTKDVEPWLGDGAGAAVLGIDADSGDSKVFAWVELKDSSAFEDFAKGRDYKKSSTSVNGFDVWTTSDDDTVIGVKDDLAILAENKKQFASIVKFDGDSITDADGVGDAIDAVDSDSLATVVVNGTGIRKAAATSDQLKSFAEADQLKNIEALAVAASAQDDGVRLDGALMQAEEGDAKNVKHPLFESLPESTVLAVGGYDLGGVVKDTVEGAGKDDPQVQQGVGAISAILGLDTSDLAKSLDGEFALALSADGQGLGALAGGVAGAAMGGGVSASNIGQLLKAGTVLLAFEETGDTADTLGKVAGGVGGLTGSTAAPKTATQGDFTTATQTVQGVPVTVGKSDDVAAVSVGVDVFSTWGENTLGDSDAFQDAWKAADGPDESVSIMWLDAARIGQLAGLTGSEDAKLGGMVGWSEADGKEYDFTAFLHVTSGS